MRSEPIEPDGLERCEDAQSPLAMHREEKSMSKFVTRFLKDESGATAIEYGLIAALIAVVIIGATTAIGTNLSTKFTTVANTLK
jgi:pilus assembly protein Flp/PilA